VTKQSYIYYPGCSVEATGIPYDLSTRAVCDHLGIELQELDDWNCCGATAYLSVEDIASMAVAARNLAIAEPSGLDVITPCSACYITLNKVNHYFEDYPEIREKISSALSAAELEYKGGVDVRHLLFMFTEDIGMDRIAGAAREKLNLRVAPYYGCQVVRPFTENDSPDVPFAMDDIISALGGEVVDYPLKTKCCSGALIGIDEKTALDLAKPLIECAVRGDADCIVTCCPLCQLNLDAYQYKINKAYGTDYHIPVLFFTQLMGLAYGIDEKRLGLNMNIEPYRPAARAKGASG
jgi:heterodisulfide reductase subunit B